MKMQEAADIISGKADRSGYVISFEVRECGMLRSDHFPDVHAGEPGVETLADAWRLAEAFAAKRSHKRDVMNVRLCRAEDFTPAGPDVLNRYPAE